MDAAKTQSVVYRRLIAIMVWVLRIGVGGTFLFSGFVKCIDPWGFVYKIEDYLEVWHIHWLWREVVLCIAVTISTIEFCGGFAMLTGCLRRSVVLLLLMFEIVMLPLTAYIMIANPVADCGCFGDALIISNTATFVKNVVLTAAIIVLLIYNSRVKGLYPPLSQAMPMILSVAYCLVIAFIGITIQPMIDFRPFKVGTPLVDDSDHDLKLIYEKNGKQQTFDIDMLPDSTWTYVGRSETSASGGEIGHQAFAVFDGDDEVTDQVISTDGSQVLLIVSNANHHKKSRASMANNLNYYIDQHGGSMIGIVGTSAEGLQRWSKEARPDFDVYTADDTDLKTLVRGDAGIVYLIDGKIMWKRNIYSLSGDFPDFQQKINQLDNVRVIDNGNPIRIISVIYLGALIIFYLLGLIRIKNVNNSAQNKN